MRKSMMFEQPEEVNACFLTNTIMIESEDDFTTEELDMDLIEYSEGHLGETEKHEYHTIDALVDYFENEVEHDSIKKVSKANRIITIDLREDALGVGDLSGEYIGNKIVKGDGKYLYTVDFKDTDPDSSEFYIMLMVDTDEGSGVEVFYSENEDFKEIYNSLNSIIKDNSDDAYELLSNFEAYLQDFNRLDSVFVFDDINQMTTMLFPYPFLHVEAYDGKA